MIVYIDMDDVLCNFKEAYSIAIGRNPDIKFPQSQYGFFTELEPKDGAIGAAMAMQESSKIDPYILTAPSTRNPLCYTEKRIWVEKWLGYSYVKKLIICPNKGLLKGDVLIDDYDSGKGQECFEGKLIHFGSTHFPNWKSVRAELNI